MALPFIGFSVFCSYFSFFMFQCGMSICSDHQPSRGWHATVATTTTTTHDSTLGPKKLYIILIRPERNVRQSMMPVRYSAMHKTTGTGPSSMMAAIMVTAATCNQNEKIEKQTTIYPAEDASKLKVLSTGNSYAKQIYAPKKEKHNCSLPAFFFRISFASFYFLVCHVALFPFHFIFCDFSPRTLDLTCFLFIAHTAQACE